MILQINPVMFSLSKYLLNVPHIQTCICIIQILCDDCACILSILLLTILHNYSGNNPLLGCEEDKMR